MGLTVGHEKFIGGKWRVLQLNGNNAGHLKAIVVGSSDFILKGKQKDIVKWLADFKKPVKCTTGYGNDIWIILRGKAASVSEEIAKMYGSAFGVGGIGSCLFTGVTAVVAVSDAVAAAAGVALNESDINIDSVLDSCMSKSVTVRISCAKGPHRNTAGDSVVKLSSGLSARYSAGALAALKW